MSLAIVDLRLPSGRRRTSSRPRGCADRRPQDRHPWVVPERHPVEVNPAVDRRQYLRVSGFSTVGRVTQLVELDDRGLSLLVEVVLLHQQLDRQEERVEVEHERRQLPDGQRPAHHRAADEQQHRLADDPHELRRRSERRHDRRRSSFRSRYSPTMLRWFSTLWRWRLKPTTTRTPCRLSDTSVSTAAIPSRMRP